MTGSFTLKSLKDTDLENVSFETEDEEAGVQCAHPVPSRRDRDERCSGYFGYYFRCLQWLDFFELDEESTRNESDHPCCWTL